MEKQRGGVNHPKFQDLTGKISGQLKISRFINRPRKNGKSQWLWECNCSCGEIIYVRTSRLNGVEANQERCKKCQEKVNGKNRILSNYMQIRNFLFGHYKRRSQSRGYNFELTFDYFDNLIQQNCYYCGQEPEEHRGDLIRLQEKIPFKRNGIDRLNNDLGYTVQNSVSCCTMCNFAKLNFSVEEFSNWLKRLINYQKINKTLNIF